MPIRSCILLALSTLASLAMCRPAPAAAAHAQAMDFEVAGAWRTAPDLLDEFSEKDLWSTRTIPFKELAGGVKLSSEHVKSGRFSARWADHPRYPTIHTTDAPRDWSAYRALTVWAYSEVATGEIITLAVRSDSNGTAWQDYFIYDFTVDWTGWRELAFPLAAFDRLGEPAGWGSVSGVFFFTKIFNRQPNPYTVLHLDAMRLVEMAPSQPVAKRKPKAKRDGRLVHSGKAPEFNPAILNHTYPETRSGKPVFAPIQYRPYFKAERTLYGYYPRFQPGFVSFDPKGRAYLRYGSYIVENRGADCKWTYTSVLDTLEQYAREQLGFDALAIANAGQGESVSIRFDRDGDAYMLGYISDPTQNWRSRTGLLLHSRDGMKTWAVYRLPWYMARFEKRGRHNVDCLARPPVILMSRYFAPTQIFITIPQKRDDGSLEIPKPTMIADDAIPMIPHSGEANQAITHGDTVFIAYSRPDVLPGHTVKDGMPAYVATYDIAARNLSKPVLIGFGGINAKDAHNWAALAADSTGIIHAIINGHHNHFMYTHTTKPWAIDAWAEPIRVAAGTSYAGLVCDSKDTLYSVTRNSHPGYYFRLSLHRKKAGQPWEAPKHLVLPFKPYYKIYYHRLVIDPATDRLFLSYYSQSASICVFKDEFLAYLYTWPDREQRFFSGKRGAYVPLGTYREKPRKYAFYQPPPSELTVLVSEDGGETWRLAVTEDF